ncbi:hypothetical protein C2E21_1808 [Chlorella sorokiniana]|uniref:Uncharacterized protein n=1 Tax=Chlorella sorokiniana TaxID=3076 RepID=A0A2P6TZV4_CHLSO|nr:hypothetical protein C2E21_1808 [Chlorella sorokiniana]|eukprot:PRW59593.1 hypothetical protein C2E21_1808 [Chlorella sorokiniana]
MSKREMAALQEKGIRVGDTVAHNPSTLEKVEPGSSEEESEELGKAKSAVKRSGRGRQAKGGKKGGAAGKKADNGEKPAAGGPKAAATKKAAGGGKAAGAAAHAARHSSRIATRRHRREAGTSEAVAGEEKVGYRKRGRREE